MCRSATVFLAVALGLTVSGAILLGLSACGMVQNVAGSDTPLKPFGGVIMDLEDFGKHRESIGSVVDPLLRAAEEAQTIPPRSPRAVGEPRRTRQREKSALPQGLD
jgi:hypothetical protein